MIRRRTLRNIFCRELTKRTVNSNTQNLHVPEIKANSVPSGPQARSTTTQSAPTTNNSSSSLTPLSTPIHSQPPRRAQSTPSCAFSTLPVGAQDLAPSAFAKLLPRFRAEIAQSELLRSALSSYTVSSTSAGAKSPDSGEINVTRMVGRKYIDRVENDIASDVVEPAHGELLQRATSRRIIFNELLCSGLKVVGTKISEIPAVRGSLLGENRLPRARSQPISA